MTGIYDARLVALSVAIAIVAAYTALSLAGRVTAAAGRARAAWLAGGAVAMGIGIWSMHFVGMLSFSLPIPITYDVPTVLASLLIAILASGLALALVSRPIMRRRAWLAGGALMGGGIASMHYIGMAAMRMDAMTTYQPVLVLASLAIAVGASLAALWLAFRLRKQTRVWNAATVGAAAAMGLAIAGMHYTAMAAATFRPMIMPGAAEGIQPSGLGGAALGLATLIALGGTLLTTLVDRRRALLATVATERAMLLAREREARVAAERATAQLQAVLDVLPVGVIIADATGRLTLANGAAQTLWGETPLVNSIAEYQTYRGWRTDTGRRIAAEEWALARALTAGEVTGGEELEIETFEGERKTVLNHAAPIRDESGAIAGGVVAVVDITARRRLERRTHEALDALLCMAEALVQPGEGDPAEQDMTAGVPAVAQRLAALTRSVLDCRRVAITGIDQQSGARQPIAAVGLNEEDVAAWRSGAPGTSLHECLSAEELERLWRDDLIVVDDEGLPRRALPYGARSMLVALLRPGRDVVGVLTLDHGSARHTYAADEVALARAVARLIALVLERERLLHDRAQAEARVLALQQANRKMDTFLALASHELKTPLTSISGSIEIVMRRLRRAPEGEREPAAASMPLLDRAHQNLWRINRLVDDLLDMSRIQADRLELRCAPCDLVPLLTGAVQDQRELYPDRELRLHLPATGGAIVRGDAGRLEQVVQNYLTNALKYAPPDQPIDAGIDVADRRARVWVRDRGPGLPPREQEQVWERFYRVEGIGHRTGSRIGLGLGLYISRTIIERHGGRVGVESAPGEGATFWFTLPIEGTPGALPCP